MLAKHPVRFIDAIFRCLRNSALRTLLPAFVGLGCLASPALAEDLRAEVLTALRKATYEVVVEKPKTDSLSYEKPLPLDLLPYRERNDKYESIGTAFALANGQFVSAAHVVSLGADSVRRRIHLRNAEGVIVRLDRVLKFSTARDFIVFTVKDYVPAGVLEPSAAQRKNDKIFTVGNALGEGVIARDGMYTSDTLEEEDGRWSWIRFSAAASPGNSGGPLVDRDGRVIGVVLRKSENENLNFALPISEVLKASAAAAEISSKVMFKLDITDRTLQSKLDQTIGLPLGYQEFGQALQAMNSRFVASLSEQFKAANRDDMFPDSPGAQGLLYRATSAAPFPHVLAKQRDGTWDASLPSERRRAEVGKNGSLSFGTMGNFVYLRLQAPEDVPAAQMHGDSKAFMDVLLRGLYYSRSFGPERVRITSLGRAKEETVHIDAYQRKWQVRRWSVEHSDETIITYALPQPGGYAILLNEADEAASAMYEIDLKTLTDFVFVTYYGTLKQWAEFLAARDMLPAAFDSIAIEPAYGKEFRYRSKRLSFSYPHDLMKVTQTSDLHLKFAYFKENGRVVWDVTSVVAGEDKNTSTSVSLSRHLRPPETLPDSDRRTWESLVERRLPYTGTSFFDKSSTIIGSPHPAQQGDMRDPSRLYSIVYAADGTHDAPTMAQRLARFHQGISIHER
ncbi:MAG: serine protease [Polaromonas sp.]|nr:serine protease [Polaromonas sp.]